MKIVHLTRTVAAAVEVRDMFARLVADAAAEGVLDDDWVANYVLARDRAEELAAPPSKRAGRPTGEPQIFVR